MRTLVIALLVLIATSVSAASLPQKIDAIATPYVQWGTFGGVVLVAKGDDVLFEKAYGLANHELNVPNTVETRFRLASITKLFTNALLHRLAADGKLAFSDPLANYVPGFPRADHITIEHLMKHRSGIRDPEKLRRTIGASHTAAEVVEQLKSEPFGSEPGETYSYTTANYTVLALVIEKVTGKPYEQAMRDLVYTPAGMRGAGDLVTTSVVPRLASSYMPNPFGSGVAVSGPEDASWKASGGSAYATARDVHRFFRAYYANRLFPGRNPRETWSLSKVHNRDAARASGAFPGANAHAVYFVDDELTVVVLSNNYATATGRIAADTAAAYLGEPYRTLDLKPLAAAPPFDPRLLGTYLWDGIPYPSTIALRDGRPVLRFNVIRQSAMVPIGPNEYFLPMELGTVRFAIAENGTIEASYLAFGEAKPLKMTKQ